MWILRGRPVLPVGLQNPSTTQKAIFCYGTWPIYRWFSDENGDFPVRNLSHFRRLVTSPMNIYQFSYRTNKHNWLVVSTPLKKIVSWDDYSQYMEK